MYGEGPSAHKIMCSEFMSKAAEVENAFLLSPDSYWGHLADGDGNLAVSTPESSTNQTHIHAAKWNFPSGRKGTRSAFPASWPGSMLTEDEITHGLLLQEPEATANSRDCAKPMHYSLY